MTQFPLFFYSGTWQYLPCHPATRSFVLGLAGCARVRYLKCNCIQVLGPGLVEMERVMDNVLGLVKYYWATPMTVAPSL